MRIFSRLRSGVWGGAGEKKHMSAFWGARFQGRDGLLGKDI